MVQKSSYFNVLEVFFREPTEIHFVKEISRKIGLAHTSVRRVVIDLLADGLIIKKKGKPFDGFVANRENDEFLFRKRVRNIDSLFELKERIIEELHPSAIVVFGSYSWGEDVEGSDIDILVLSKVKKKLVLEKFEKELGREINVIIVDSLGKLDEPIRKKVINGIVICGGLDG